MEAMTLPDLRELIPEATISISALIAILVGALARNYSSARRIAPAVALIGLVAAVPLMFAVPHATTVPTARFEGVFVADAFAVCLKLLFSAVGVIATLVSVNFLEAERQANGEYYGLLLLAVVGMMLTASARDVVLLFLGLEVLSLSTYVLVGYLRKDPHSTESAIKYFLLSSFATALLLYGLSLLYGISGGTSYAAIRAAGAHLSGDLRLVAMLSVVFLTAGIGFKATLVPFHMYAPDVYQGAPGCVAAFLAVGPKLAAFGALIRLLVEAMPGFASEWVPLLTVVSILTMTIGNLVALSQSNVKRMLAYSSIAHAGYMLIGIVAAFTPGVTADVRSQALAAVVYYLVAYTFMKMGAFGILLSIKPGDRFAETLDDLRGLGRRRPLAAALLLVFLLSLIGIPLTAGFTAKFYVFSSAISAGCYTLAIAGILNAVVAATYYSRIAIALYAVEPGRGEPYAAGGISLKVALAASAIAILLLGIFPGRVLETALQSVRSLF
ncbi:MAG: NADH-quinone oxidoreductase subunit N [Planctomycetes bacterium]|nr:NADH-quinone oxidoreductase subunit N [Planctomycetota bacterium]